MMITLPALEQAWVPVGCVTLRGSAKRICAVQLNEAVPLEPTLVAQGAYRNAVTTMWKEVDEGRLVPWVFSPQGNVALPAGITRTLPLLRHPKVLSLNYVRPGHRFFSELVALLGKTFPSLPVGFEANLLKKLEKRIRNANARNADKLRPGRPRTSGLHAAIEKIIETGEWTLSQRLKLLTGLVNDELRRQQKKPTTNKTVATALENLAWETGDPRFRRLRR